MSKSRSESTITGPVENGRCYLQVAFGSFTPQGLRLKLPPERTVIDTYHPGISLTEKLAKDLGLEPEVINIPPPGPKGSKWSKNAKGIVQIYYQVHDAAGDVVWNGEANAIVSKTDRPCLGMGQLLAWHFSIDGPAGHFSVRFPGNQAP